jgi:hydroxylamine dehydrogenase
VAQGGHHAKAGNILASLDNYLAETVEGARLPFNPHSPTPERDTGPSSPRPIL